MTPTGFRRIEVVKEIRADNNRLGVQIPPGAPKIMALTRISSGMRSGPLWFLPIFCPHFKKVETDFRSKCGLFGFAQPSVCLGCRRRGEVHQLTFDQSVRIDAGSPVEAAQATALRTRAARLSSLEAQLFSESDPSMTGKPGRTTVDRRIR